MIINSIILTEPKEIDNFYPFTINNPLWEIRVGALKIWQKLKLELPNIPIIYSGRPKHTKAFLENYQITNPKLKKGFTLVVSSEIIFNSDFFDELSSALINYPDTSLRLTFLGKTIGAIFSPINWVENLKSTDLNNLESSFWENFPEIEFAATKIIKHQWEAIYQTAEEIIYDAQFFKNYKSAQGNVFPGVHLLNPSKILIGSGVRIYPGVVIDAMAGPVIISSNVKIMAQATIIGPCFIGANTTIKVGAKIYENTSIGEWCKVGGEVENSILQSYSNKQHEGFLGHSYIGSWVNIGADTNTSDLKNTYGNITVQIRDREIETNQMFLGLLCGDHTKTAINTQFNTGTICGIAAIIFNEGFPPKFIKSFSWGGKKDSYTYKFDQAIKTAKIMMARRNKSLSAIDEELLRDEYELNIEKK